MAAMRPGDWMCMSCGNHNFASRATCNKCGAPKQAGGCGFGMVMAPVAAAPKVPGKTVRVGDWMCPACGNHNYANREACNKCGAAKTEAAVQGTGAKAMRPGDWMCSGCGNHNYANREACNKCGAPRPEESGGAGAYGPAGGGAKPAMSPYIRPGGDAGIMKPMKEGDWICPECNNHNYATRVECNKCGVVKEGFRKGDWICKACKNHNYANKMQCNKCGAPRNDGVMMAGMQGGMMMMPMMGNGAFGGCGMGAQMNPMQGPMNQMAGGKGGGCMGGAAGAAWVCTQCGNNNFANRVMCNRCGAPKPQPVVGLQQMPGQMQQLPGQMPRPSTSAGFAAGGGQTMRAGDWMCKACNNHNYASRESCNKCGAPKEADQ